MDEGFWFFFSKKNALLFLKISKKFKLPRRVMRCAGAISRVRERCASAKG
jgi:hypothetical protein